MKQKSTHNNTFSSFIFLVIIGLLLVFIFTVFRVNAPGGFSFTPSSTPASPNETQTVAAIVTLKAIGEATHLATTRTPITPIYLPTGIYDNQRVKVSAALLFIDAQNAWGGFFEGYRITIYAGALQSDPDQGVVCIVTTLLEGKSFEQFLTPSKHGALRVVSEQNSRLTLTSTDGTVYYFDIPTRQFVASLSGIAPSVTPSPTITITPKPTSVPYDSPSTSPYP